MKRPKWIVFWAEFIRGILVGLIVVGALSLFGFVQDRTSVLVFVAIGLAAVYFALSEATSPWA